MFFLSRWVCLSALLIFIYSQCQIPYCYTYRLLCATRSFGGCGRHLRI